MNSNITGTPYFLGEWAQHDVKIPPAATDTPCSLGPQVSMNVATAGSGHLRPGLRACCLQGRGGLGPCWGHRPPTSLLLLCVTRRLQPSTLRTLRRNKRANTIPWTALLMRSLYKKIIHVSKWSVTQALPLIQCGHLHMFIGFT